MFIAKERRFTTIRETSTNNLPLIRQQTVEVYVLLRVQISNMRKNYPAKNEADSVLDEWAFG